MNIGLEIPYAGIYNDIIKERKGGVYMGNRKNGGSEQGYAGKVVAQPDGLPDLSKKLL